jgi:hypothetical protein
VAKSHLSALTFEHLRESDDSWTLVEIEQKPSYTQRLYEWPAGARLFTHALIAHDEMSNQPKPSLRPLDELWNLMPPEEETLTSCRIIADFGASAFQSFLLWGIQHQGLAPFIDAQFRFVFVIPVLGAEIESQSFFNNYGPNLLKLGKVVLVKNLLQGNDFSMLDANLVNKVPAIRLLHRGPPLSAELIHGRRRLTYRQLAGLPSASRRAKLDARDCDADFTSQFQQIASLFT